MRMVIRTLVVIALTAGTVVAAPADGHVTPTTRLAVLPAGDGRPVAAPFPVSHVGLRWRGSEDAAMEIRTAAAAGRWGPWRPVGVAHDLGDEAAGVRLSGLLRADGARLVQARAAGEVRRVEVIAIDAVSGYPASAVPAASPATAVPAAAPGEGPGQPDVLSRAVWGADEGMRKGAPEFARPVKLVVHHTVTPNDDPDPASTVRAIYAYHTRTNGWNDIGYNFLVDAQGRIYEGRHARSYRPGEVPTGEDESGRGVIGAHARGVNAGSVGVALLGDFSGGAEPAPAALDSLVRLLAWKAGRHGIDPEGADAYTAPDGSSHSFPNLAGHRDVGQTACPGGRLYDRLPEVRRRVAEAVGTRPAPAPTPPPPVPTPPVPVPDIPGFWTATAGGVVHAFGDATRAGDLTGRPLNAPIVALAASPSGKGYWLAGADGGVFAFGDAPFRGSAAGTLTSPAVHLEPTPSGQGYWLVTAGGDIVPFGDAVFLGSTAPLPLEVAGMAATPTGQGYWVAVADGRVFAFGDAVTSGVTTGRVAAGAVGAVHPAAPIVSIAAHPDGRGYWLLGRDGGVFAVDVPFHGSVPARHAYTGAVQLRVAAGGEGYYVAADDGAVFAFGKADRRRERPGRPEEAGVVDLALLPEAPSAGRPPAPAPPLPPAPAAAGETVTNRE